MPINASQDVFNDKVTKTESSVNDVLRLLGEDLGRYGFTGTVGVMLTAVVSGKDTERPMSKTIEATYGFKNR